MLGIAPSPDTSPKITIVDICPPYLPNTNQGVVSVITVFGQVLWDKCQTTGDVSAYVYAEIR